MCRKFTGEHPCQSVISINSGLHDKFTLWHGCSPVNLLHVSEHLFLRTPLGGCFYSSILIPLFVIFVCFQSAARWLSFSKWSSRYSNIFLSCLSSESSTLNVISTPLVFASLFLSELGYLHQFVLLVKVYNSNNAHINIPGHLSSHLSYVLISFRMLHCAYSTK